MRATLASLLVMAMLVTACTTPGSGADTPTTGAERWRTAALRNAVTGDEFRISDFAGKVVFIEVMAVWCVSCRHQQVEAQAALDAVGSPDVVYVSLDVDPNEREADLADYARREGFDWRFAVAPVEVSRSLAATFGDQVLSPPATPLIVLGRDGEVAEMHLGGKSARDLVALFERLLS